MRHTTAWRVLAGLGVAGVIIAATAAPATAQESEVRLGIVQSDLTVPAGATGKVASPVITASETIALQNGVITVDLAGLAGVASVSEIGGAMMCERAASTVTCRWTLEDGLGLSPGGGGGYVDLTLVAAAGAKTGDSGTLRFTFSADGASTAVHESVVRIGEAVDLADGTSVKLSGAPGDNLSAPLTVRNAGTAAADGAAVILHFDDPFRGGTLYDNCLYVGDDPLGCRFEQQLAPGSTFRATMSLRLGADTLAPSTAFGQTEWMTLAEFEDYLRYRKSRGLDNGKPGQAGVLTLATTSEARAFQADPRSGNNWGSVEATVTGKNSSDLVAVGDAVSGVAGDTVTATVGVANKGPATLTKGRSGSPATLYQLTLPPGTTAVDVPETCVPVVDGEPVWEDEGKAGAATYRCPTDLMIRAGVAHTDDFKLRIDEVIADAVGTVRANPSCDPGSTDGWRLWSAESGVELGKRSLAR